MKKQHDNLFLKAFEVIKYTLLYEYELFNVEIGTDKCISIFNRWTVKLPFAV